MREMTTERQLAANRKNAKKSTGPRSEAGKNRASTNARRHGLNTPPEPKQVLSLYRMILNDPAAVPDLNTFDARQTAAFALAEAEARLRRVSQVERQFIEDVNHLEAVRRERRAYFAELKAAGHTLEDICRVILASPVARTEPGYLKLRVAMRYRAEAEAGRIKALRRWIRVCRIPETNPPPGRPEVDADVGEPSAGETRSDSVREQAKQPADNPAASRNEPIRGRPAGHAPSRLRCSPPEHPRLVRSSRRRDLPDTVAMCRPRSPPLAGVDGGHHLPDCGPAGGVGPIVVIHSDRVHVGAAQAVVSMVVCSTNGHYRAEARTVSTLHRRRRRVKIPKRTQI